MKKVTKIEGVQNNSTQKKKLRVAAYCRVSTGSDAQLESLEAQKTHYERYINSREDGQFAGLYFDEGITGTKAEKRPELLRLISDCESKKIDFVITKSISRFAVLWNASQMLSAIGRIRSISASPLSAPPHGSVSRKLRQSSSAERRAPAASIARRFSASNPARVSNSLVHPFIIRSSDTRFVTIIHDLPAKRNSSRRRLRGKETCIPRFARRLVRKSENCAGGFNLPLPEGTFCCIMGVQHLGRLKP